MRPLFAGGAARRGGLRVRAGGLGEPVLVGAARGAALELRDPVLQRRALLSRGGERLRERRFRGSASRALGLQRGRPRSARAASRSAASEPRSARAASSSSLNAPLDARAASSSAAAAARAARSASSSALERAVDRARGLELRLRRGAGGARGREACLRGDARATRGREVGLERGAQLPLGRQLRGEGVGEAGGVLVALHHQGVALGLAGEPLGRERGGELVALGERRAGGGPTALAGAVQLGLERRAGDGLHAQARLRVGRRRASAVARPVSAALQRALEVGDPRAQRRRARRRGVRGRP